MQRRLASRKKVFFLILFIGCLYIVGANPIVLEDSSSVYSSNSHLYRFKGNPEQSDEIFSFNKDSFLWESVADQFFFGNLEEGAWFAIPFTSKGLNVEFFFQLDYYYIDHLLMYLIDQGTVLQTVESGIYHPSEILPFNYIGHTMPLGFLEEGDYTLLFYLKTDEAYLPLRFLSSIELFNQSNKELLFYGLIYGVLITFLLVNIYFIIFNKENSRSTLYFMLFLLFELLYQASRDGFLNIFLWPYCPYLIKRFYLLSLTITNIGGFLLLAEFLQLKKASKRLYSLVLIHLLPAVIFFFLFALTPDSGLTGVISVGRYFQMYLIFLEICITASRIKKGTLPDRVFSIGWILGMVFFLLATLKAKGILPYQHFQIFVLIGVFGVTICQLVASGLRAQENSRNKAYVEDKFKRASYQIMQNRGRPHFLMNTFNLLQQKIVEDPSIAHELISLMISDFTFYTRKALTPLIPLSEELQFIDNYQKIISMRFENVEFQNEQSIIDSSMLLVPPISLQPLVENAVKYSTLINERRIIYLVFMQTDTGFCWTIENPTNMQAPIMWGETHRNIFSRLSYYHPNVTMELSISDGKYRVEIFIPG